MNPLPLKPGEPKPWEAIDIPIIALIDTSALVHRAFHAIQGYDGKLLTDPKGRPINAVYGFASSILAVLEVLQPRYLVCALDVKGQLHRSKQYDQYKAHRKPVVEELKSQFPIVEEMITKLGIPHFGIPGYEADDMIGTLAKQAERNNVFAVIVTGDMDALQLVNGNVAVLSVTKGAKELTWYNSQSVVDKYGLKPDQLKDYKGLVGDSSDNIPGVPGIGPKTAAELLQHFSTLDALYAAIESESGIMNHESGGKQKPIHNSSFIIRNSLRTKLLAHKDLAMMSRELGTIDIHVPIELDLHQALANAYDRTKASAYFESLGFKSLVRRLPEAIVSVKQESLF